MANKEQLEQARFLFELFSSSYAQVGETVKTLDQKIHNTLSLSATLTTLFVGILYYVLSSQSPISSFRREYVVAFTLGTFMLFLVVMLGVFAYKPRPTLALGAEEFRMEYIEKELLEQVRLAAVNMADMEKKNRYVVGVKARYYLAMLVFQTFGVLCFVVGFGFLALPYLAPLNS